MWEQSEGKDPCQSHKWHYISLNRLMEKKGWQVEVFKFICHVFFNQPGKIMCRVSSKHARAGLFYTRNISERSFSIAILWNKRSKISCFLTDISTVSYLGDQTKCIISIFLQDYYFIYSFFFIFIQSDSVFIGVDPSWAFGFRPSSPGLPAKPKPVHRGVCPEQTRGDSHCLAGWLW